MKGWIICSNSPLLPYLALWLHWMIVFFYKSFWAHQLIHILTEWYFVTRKTTESKGYSLKHNTQIHTDLFDNFHKTKILLQWITYRVNLVLQQRKMNCTDVFPNTHTHTSPHIRTLLITFCTFNEARDLTA